MTFLEKLSKLTPKHLEELGNVSETEQLDAFVSKHGIDLNAEEKTQVLDYLKNGKLPLEDEALDLVAGGRNGTGHGSRPIMMVNKAPVSQNDPFSSQGDANNKE